MQKESESPKLFKAIVDIVFLCDFTGSMGIFVDKTKDTIKQTLEKIHAQYPSASIFFGFIAYRDHCDGNALLQIKDLTEDVESVYKFIDKLVAHGGGDAHEAVVDALNAGLEISWRENSVKQAVLILDSPPHGKEFGESGNKFPNGCPCNKDYKKILKEMQRKGIKLLVLNFTSAIANMIRIFSDYYTGIESVEIKAEAKDGVSLENDFDMPISGLVQPNEPANMKGGTTLGNFNSDTSSPTPAFALPISTPSLTRPLGTTPINPATGQQATQMTQKIGSLVCKSIAQKIVNMNKPH